MADYGKLPASAKLHPKPFKAHIDEEKLEAMKTLLKLSPIGPAVFENTSKDQGESLVTGKERRYGMRRDWLIDAKEHWLGSFDWRKHEDHINSFPQFTVPVTGDDGVTIDVHFMALFSENPDAVPIGFFHGWPGSFLEFLGIFGILKERYSPKDLAVPYRCAELARAAELMHKLMVGIGFESGYLAQGGDIGSSIARHLAVNYDACRGMHLNAYFTGPPKDEEKAKQMDDFERKVMARGGAWRETGMAYAMEHSTRTGTIGLALSSSPLALLAWIGEKFLEWTDDDPPLETILESVTLYWLTETFPRCIYPYRGMFAGTRPPLVYVGKPSGYSLFPKELVPVPKSWAAATANIVSYAQHQKGGHFAALEQPAELLADVEEWVPKAWHGSAVPEESSSAKGNAGGVPKM
ncbi:hypothetical protein LTR91_020100 [Friedmanniomyces endolithicus]|uniref:Epoxide hydrolase N-terminal domain-containing protein n=1 Tax=Friedmanniomyces endolithicus TaxID=329885 RepID=A0AAN6K1F2_9PEZI|nr:hypothetical protein LTR59_016971 [Friedmanniomyces endolithicus]KAK0785679.1 hypothetical protein LTR38_012279 [Friedmanniomyces endolithicus]KAK0854169.1 hypothetical protein LTR03_002540 [Friedmanniomyces endolithicus]KAK0870223.1 hypothetical protein LTR87_013376 [Friedmanniomyces endolithicus]KAK0896880.1 hypothetical protein LTR02_010986 [Friedmanniomyces endolithicus]